MRVASWAWSARGLALVAALVACKSVFPLGGRAIILLSFYLAAALWRFDRVPRASAGASAGAPGELLFMTDPRLDREALLAQAGRGDEWAHTSRRCRVWNPPRAELELVAALNPLLALGFWFGVYGGAAVLLTSAAMLGLVLGMQAALDLAQQMTLEACQKQAEYVWAHKRPRVGAGAAGAAGASAGAGAAPRASPRASPRGALAPRSASPAVSPPRAQLPRQNPRRASSYRGAQTLQVPEMAPRRVASMASRENMRSHFEQAV